MTWHEGRHTLLNLIIKERIGKVGVIVGRPELLHKGYRKGQVVECSFLQLYNVMSQVSA